MIPMSDVTIFFTCVSF